MSGTYYNLPTISCDNRNKTWPEASKASICNNLNPDKIYNSLFPCDNNPMQAYPNNNNHQIPNNIYNNSKFMFQKAGTAREYKTVLL